MNFVVHGTALNAHNLELSADVPGGIERALEQQLHAPVLFINGAEGDVSPAEGGYEGIANLSHSFGKQASHVLANAKPMEATWSVRSSTIQLGDPAVTVGASASTRSATVEAATLWSSSSTCFIWPGSGITAPSR